MSIIRWLKQRLNPAALRLMWYPHTTADIQEAVDWEQTHRT